MNNISLTLLSSIGQAATSPTIFGLSSYQVQFTIIMVGFIAFFYFFIIRPQNKKRKDAETMLNSIKKGDKVVTIGGMHGKVSAVKETEIVIKVDANAEITLDKSAIAKVINPNASESSVKDDKKRQLDKKGDNKEKIEDKTS
jgi:preprotein translocase subunit YajC